MKYISNKFLESQSFILPFQNGPLKRQHEVNGHSHIPHFGAQPTGECSGDPVPVASQPPSHHSSQAAFTPISQPSPKSVNSGGLHPAQQQVVAPVSDPKEKFGQGRIGSQTLFTPYAATAITRVRSPLGGGGPPSASSASQSSAATVIQPESPKEPLVPASSPFTSLPHHHTIHHQNPPHHPHQQHHHHQYSVQNNQHLHQTINSSSSNSNSGNNRGRSVHPGYNNLPVGNSYSANANILTNTSSNSNSHSHGHNSKPSHPASQSLSSSSRKLNQQFPNSSENYSTTFGRPQSENSYKKVTF